MSAQVTCQHEIDIVDDGAVKSASWPCGKPVRNYRQCGRGCSRLAVYCPDHGGDERAQREMTDHHLRSHRSIDDPLPGDES